MIHAIRNHFARLAELPAGKAWWRIGLESLIVTIAVAIPIATFVDKPRPLLTIPLPILILLILVIAPLLETVLGQWLPVAATARLRARLGLQVAVATAVFALLHVGEGFIYAICPGLVAGFYLAWNFAHKRRRSTRTALVTTAGIHFVQNLGGVLLLSILLLGPLVGGSGLLPSPRTWFRSSEAAAARLHRKLQADPTDKRAMAQMLRLMDRGACTQEQVEFIARTVLVPEVVARQVYSSAGEIGVRIHFPDGALARLPHWQVDRDLRISLRNTLGDGRERSASIDGVGRERQSSLYRIWIPFRGQIEPGDYTCELDLAYTYRHCRLKSFFRDSFGFAMAMMQENINPATGSWIEPPMEALTMKVPSTKFTPVTARFTRMIAFSVQPDSEVAPIRLLRSPQLDRAMEKRLVPYPHLGTSGGRAKWYRGLLGVAFRDLPCAVAWEPVFVDAQGIEHDLSRDPTMGIFIRIVSQGDTGAICSWYLADWSLDFPIGEHPGHLVLRPDPKLASLDPEIEEIWGGELRFPTKIVVSPGSSAHAANSPEPSDTTKDATSAE